MKKFLLSLLVMVASVALAQEVTFDFKSNPWGCTLGSGTGPTAEAGNIPEITQDGVVLTFDIGTHTNTPPRMWNGPQLRVYKGNTITLTVPAGKTVVKAVWTATGADYHGLAVAGVDVDATAGWSGSATEVVFDVTKNSRYNTLVVTLAGEGEEPGAGGEEPGTGGGEEPGEGEEPGTGGETGDLSAFNGDFETWVDGLPNNWKTASTAGNATLSQSTDAHSGNYSVCVAGTTSGNKRIGYKEMTLKAGTYTMKFYAKAATETGASVRPGYTPVDDANKAGSYVYGDYTNDITTSEWVEVTHEFTLEADTRLSLVIMNAKNPGGNVLIDDFTLETTDGGILDGGNTENPDQGEGGGDEPGQGEDPTPEVPSVSALWTSSFANNMGGFSLDNKVMPAGLSYVWQYDSNYSCMKASAFANSTRYETEAWLVSPVLSLANATECSLVFDQAANYFNTQEIFLAACKVMVKESTAANWTELAYEGSPNGASWNFVTSTADLKAYAGKSIQLAFVYTSTSEIAGTWEVKDLTIKGKGSVEVEAPEIPVPAYTTIAELKSNATDAEAAVKYTFTELLVTGVANVNGSYSVYVTDGAEGLLLYGKNVPNCKAGDKISGTIESGLKLYNGLTEITNADYTNVTVVSSDNAVTPLVLTMSEIGSDLKKYENMLVKLEGITFAANALENKNITMIDDADCEMTLRDNFGVLADFIFDPAKPYNVTAFVASYKGTPQLYPLSADDVEVISNLQPTEVAWEKEEVAILSGEAWVVENQFSVNADVRPVFSSSNEAVATVDENGLVTVVGYGMAEITAEILEDETYLASKATFKLYVIEGDGTLEKAYTVADVLYFYEKVKTPVWVKGTICGSLSKSNALTTNSEEIQASNLALGTEDSFIPVQLASKTDARAHLNLLDNPDMLGQTVWVYGNIEKYFSMPGVKSVTDFSFDGVTGIDAVETETATKGIYLLDGRRVQQTVKGINIINGKKVVVK
ncbi:MAG: choice-of-anchor J domain-containing protein [Bacteroidaceae bacterium]|nr:choice-of-anchor J domain-containing protein [Bacteroidaceae bacterium]